MSTRLDLVLQRHPEHEEGIRLLASRDPSKNLKYLDWGVKVLASGQALAPEIADILDLFHRFNGQWFGAPGRHRERGRHRTPGRERIRPDIYTYGPEDLAKLHGNLRKIKRATDRKRKKRERLYRIEGEIEADVVYDSDDLIVRHIKNKQASVHYGLGTKWCIAMLREGYFEDYETHNATFFFFERKAPVGDDLDKAALMIPRGCDARDSETTAFTALDQRVDMMALAKAYGPRVFDIFREIYERSDRYPGSVMFQVYAGVATQAQIEATFENVAKGNLILRETNSALRAICCNDAAPQPLLEEIARRASELSLAAQKRLGSRRSHYRRDADARELMRDVMAALAIHPNVSADVREKLVTGLRRRRIDIDTIRRVMEHGRVAVEYETSETRGGRKVRYNRRLRHYRRRRPSTVKALRARARMFDRTAARMRRKARTLQRKLTAAKKKKRRSGAARSKRK